MENRFKMLLKSQPEEAKRLFKEVQQDVNSRWRFYEYLSTREVKTEKKGEGGGQ